VSATKAAEVVARESGLMRHAAGIVQTPAWQETARTMARSYAPAMREALEPWSAVVQAQRTMQAMAPMPKLQLASSPVPDLVRDVRDELRHEHEMRIEAEEQLQAERARADAAEKKWRWVQVALWVVGTIIALVALFGG
jgi:hypothetical protein